MSKPATFERCVDTDRVLDALRGVNDEVTYSALANRTLLPIDRVKQVLSSSRRILLKEMIQFGIIRGVGLRRLDDKQKVRQTEDEKRGISRKAKRAIKKMETIEKFELLPNVDQLKVTMNRTILNMIRSSAEVRTTAKEPPRMPTESPASLTPALVDLLKA